MVCPKCGTDDPGVYLGLEKLECVNETCSAYAKPEPLKFWKPGPFDKSKFRFLHGDTDYKQYPSFGYRGAQHYLRPVSPSIPKEVLDQLNKFIKDHPTDFKPITISDDEEENK